MVNKQIKHSYNQGMNQDLSKSKMTNQFYFEGKNIRIVATNSQSTGSITNEKGNKFILTIPIPVINHTLKEISYNNTVLSYLTDEIESQYLISPGLYKTSGEQLIIGHTTSRNNIIVLSSDSNGFDCVWKINDTTFEITLLYLRDLRFSKNNPIQLLNNYENKNIDKIYWVDGLNQMRFINLNHSIANQDTEELIDLSFNLINNVGEFQLTQPKITEVRTGGGHSAGMIQYAYNLYKVNSSQTKASPLSELVSLDKGSLNGGGSVNEIVSSTPVIVIDSLDDDYTNLKLYAIKYTSYNQSPSISLIADRSIEGLTSFTYFDDGSIISSLSTEEIAFLGSNLIIPNHINTKDNIMFFANYKEKNFDILNLDTRCYGFNNVGVANLAGNVESDGSGGLIFSDTLTVNTSIPSTFNIPEKYPCINQDYSTYAYNDLGQVGGVGKHFRYTITRSQIGVNGFTAQHAADNRFFKDDELYRLAIQFYNKYGIISLPKWISDFVNKYNQGNLNGYYSTIKLELLPEFYVWLNTPSNFLDDNGVYDDSLKPTGYKLLRANRTELDKSILFQGIINPMMATGPSTDADFPGNDTTFGLEHVKIPSMMRRFDDKLGPMLKCENYKKVQADNSTYINTNTGNHARREAFISVDTNAGVRTGKTVQFNSLMQMYSPEIEFGTFNESSLSTYKLNVFGGLLNNINHYWGQIRNVVTKNIDFEGTVLNRISPYGTSVIAGLPNRIDQPKEGSIGALMNCGVYGGPDVNDTINDDDMCFHQYYRRYNDTFYKSNVTYNFYGSPQLNVKGSGAQRYNNNPDLLYTNSQVSFYGSFMKRTDPGSDDPNNGHEIKNVNSYGLKAMTFAVEDQLPIETIKTATGISENGIGLICELRLDNQSLYINNLYNGNSFESKKTTDYIEIGNYNNIGVSEYTCLNPGDTYVADYKFTKLVKTDTEVYNVNSIQITEIVDVKLETTIDVKNRSDESVKDWDSRFQPKDEEFQEYNQVYSQQPTLLLRKDLNYNYKKINTFDTGVISTKVKTPGELIDSFTDIQTNNVLYLDGKYGPINNLNSFKNELYTLQDNGLAFLSINPRVQIQGSDGIAVQLGTGQILERYNYISTDSGTLNKWSVVNTPSGFYYYDTLNTSLNLFKGGLEGLSDSKGLHTYFKNNTVLNTLKIDNPILKTGISSGYDYINNDVFMTFLQSKKSFTIGYNEATQRFISFYDYTPSHYISKGSNLLTSNPTTTKLYKQYDGNYNNFYGMCYPSYITLLVNPESDLDTVFDNIMYKSELYLDDLDQPDKTLSHLQLFNEHQDSGLILLVIGRTSNLRRKFRDWNAILPRNNATRERIRNPWVYLKLQLDNTDNAKLILHDIVVSYSV